MGLYIKDMEMPESCYYCPFSEGSWGYAPPNKKWCLVDGKKMPIDKDTSQHNRDDCPLIEVPPHGRLIDADANENWNKLPCPKCGGALSEIRTNGKTPVRHCYSCHFEFEEADNGRPGA